MNKNNNTIFSFIIAVLAAPAVGAFIADDLLRQIAQTRGESLAETIEWCRRFSAEFPRAHCVALPHGLLLRNLSWWALAVTLALPLVY